MVEYQPAYGLGSTISVCQTPATLAAYRKTPLP